MNILCGIAIAAPLDLLAHHPGGGHRGAEYFQLILPSFVAVVATAMVLWKLIRRG